MQKEKRFVSIKKKLDISKEQMKIDNYRAAVNTIVKESKLKFNVNASSISWNIANFISTYWNNEKRSFSMGRVCLYE